MEYYFERINEKNLHQLYLLFQAEYPGKFTLNYFQNKFSTDWTGKKFVGFLAFCKKSDEVAAFYGAFPCYLSGRNSKYLALQSGDTITHRNHRKKGLFISLANETFNLAKKEGFSLIFGFPNENSSHGFYAHLDWKQLGYMFDFTIEVKSLNFYGICHKFRIFEPLYRFYWKLLTKIYSINNEDLIFYNSSKQSENIKVSKDSYFLKYKKKYSDSELISFRKNLFWIKKDNGLSLGDMIINPKHTNIKIELQKLCKIYGVNKISFSCSSNHILFEELTQFCVARKGTTIGYRQLNQIPDLSKLEFVKADSDNY